MRSLALAVFVAAAIAYSQAIIGGEEMISIANEAGAPFSAYAMDKLQEEAMWEGKAVIKEFMDVVIINKSGKSFAVSSNSPYFFDLFFAPENHLGPRTSTVFRVFPESVDMENLEIFYMGENDNSSFGLRFDFNTPHDLLVGCSDNLDFYKIVSEGNSRHSQVRIYVNEKGGGLLSLESQPGAALVPQRKPKVSRNMFVKASKRGSSVRRI